MLTSVDFETADGLFQIGRFYRSLPVGRSVNARSLPRGLAAGWVFDFSYELQLGAFSGSPSSPNAKLTVMAPDGTGYDFVLQSSGTWIPDTATGAVYAPTELKLEYVGTLPSNLADIDDSTSTWRLTDGSDRVWTFDTFAGPNSSTYNLGRPITKATRTGYAWTFAYASDTSLTSITDSFGRVAQFDWYQFFVTSLSTPPAGSLPFPQAIASIELPDGTSLRYSYDPPPAISAPSTSTIERLIKVERLNASSAVIDSHTYHYGDTRFPTHVTGVTDNRNVRIATYAYDTRGRGTLTEGAQGTNRYLIEYDVDGSAQTRRVTNPLGKDAVFTFASFGSGPPDFRLTEVVGEASTNCPASARSLTYGTDRFVATEVDEEGRTTRYTRDAKGRPTTIVEADGTPAERTTTIVWDTVFNLPATTVQPGLTEVRDYNSLGQLETLTQTDTTTHTVPYATYGRSHVWTYDWTTTGLLESVDGPLPGTGDTTRYTYSSDGYLATRTDQVGHVTTVLTRNGRGDPLTAEDENDVETVSSYDDMGRPLTVTVNPGPSQSQYAMDYDPAGNLAKFTMPGGGWLEYSYDAASRVVSIENDRGETQTLTYNAWDQVTSAITNNVGNAVTFRQGRAYDELGRVMRQTGANSQTWKFAYDKVDNLTKTTDAQSKEWQNSWDPLDRLASQTDPEAATIDYSYAPNDSLTQLKDPRDLATDRVVDGFGLTIMERSPDRGTRTYWHDEADRLTRMIDAKGTTTNYSYDDADRPLGETFVGASGENIAYSYDATSGGNVGIGRLTGVTDGSGSSSFVYDDQGRLVTDTKVIGSETYPVAYSYDSTGLVTSITYPSGHVVTYVRAADGKITGVTARPSSLGTPANIATGVTFAPFGPLTGLTYGNGLVLTHSYDRNYWLKGINVTDGSTALLGLAFGRDGNGNLGSVTDTASTGRDAMYGYSDAARLSMSIGPWSASGPAYSEPSVIATTSNQVNAHYADGGPLPTDPHYTPGDSYSYAYNARQRLTGLKLNGSDIASYAYDHAGLRVSASQLGGTPSTVHYVFAPDGKLLAEHDGATGDLVREYIWLDDMPLALVTGIVTAPDYHYVSTGQIGEPLMVTDATKAKTWDAAIDPWGRAIMLATPTTALDLRLPGQWYQGESGLHQNWMRDYDPTLGRYVEADPLGIEAGANLYAYVDGNPLRYIDPWGLQPQQMTCGPLVKLWYDLLKASACNGLTAPRSCTGEMSIDDLQTNLKRNQACATARNDVIMQCFGGVGDPGHEQALKDSLRARDKCADRLRERGVPVCLPPP